MSEDMEMSAELHVCQICLRVDRKLRQIDKRLAEFHDEICDFTVNSDVPKYCFECEHLLKKLFNFRNKCVKSMRILNYWKKSKTQFKKPLNQIHTLIPASTLGPWSVNKSLVFITKTDEEVKDEDIPDVKLDVQQPPAKPKPIYIKKTSEVPIKRDMTAVIGRKVQKLPIIPNKSVIVQSNETEEELQMRCSESLEEASKHPVGSLFYYLLPKNAGAIPTVKKIKLKIQNPDDGEHNYSKAEEESMEKTLNQAIKLEEDSETRMSMEYGEAQVKIEARQENDDKEGDQNADFVYYDYLDDNFLYSEDIEVTNDVAIASEETVEEDEHEEKPDLSTEHVDNFYLSDDNVNSDDDFDTTAFDVVSTSKTVNREKLKAEITELFTSCGELTDDEGNEIDKAYVLSCLDDKVSEYMWRRLWKSVHIAGKKLSNRSIQLFNLIQTHCRMDAEIKNCDVEYLNTKRKILEEFRRRKHYEWYKNAKHKCEICFIPYNYEQILNTHMKHHFNSEGRFACSLCQLNYTKRNDLLKHMHNHEVLYKCKICPMATYYRTSMQTHSDKHLGKQYDCPQCDTKFNCLSWYYKHVAKAHGRTYVCTICAASFISEEKLNSHVAKHEKSVGDAENSVQCTKCDLVFFSQEVYEKHLRVSHSQSRKKFRYRKSEDGKYPTASLMACRVPGCDLRGYYGTLVYHFRTEHPDYDMDLLYADTKKHLCEICGTGYTSPYHLRYHMNKHTGTLPYPCSECSKRFHSPQALKHHELFHKPRSKACDVCGKLFRTTSNLYNHMRFHLQDRRYKCGICSKGFMHRNSLNEHIRGVHHHVRRNRKRDAAPAPRVRPPGNMKVTEDLVRGVLGAKVVEARARGTAKGSRGQGEAPRGYETEQIVETVVEAKSGESRYIEAGGEVYEVQDIPVSETESDTRLSSDYSDNSDGSDVEM